MLLFCLLILIMVYADVVILFTYINFIPTLIVFTIYSKHHAISFKVIYHTMMQSWVTSHQLEVTHCLIWKGNCQMMNKRTVLPVSKRSMSKFPYFQHLFLIILTIYSSTWGKNNNFSHQTYISQLIYYRGFPN